jgi:hypothetical protein
VGGVHVLVAAHQHGELLLDAGRAVLVVWAVLLFQPLPLGLLFAAFLVAAVEDVGRQAEVAAQVEHEVVGLAGGVGAGVAGGTDHPRPGVGRDEVVLARVGVHGPDEARQEHAPEPGQGERQPLHV